MYPSQSRYKTQGHRYTLHTPQDTHGQWNAKRSTFFDSNDKLNRRHIANTRKTRWQEGSQYQGLFTSGCMPVSHRCSHQNIRHWKSRLVLEHGWEVNRTFGAACVQCSKPCLQVHMALECENFAVSPAALIVLSDLVPRFYNHFCTRMHTHTQTLIRECTHVNY